MAAAAARANALAGAQPRVGVNIRQFGAAGDGVHDDTGAFAAALAASPTIFVPAGIYLVDRILVPSGRTILTEGFPTVLRQRPGLPATTRLVHVVGSDVRIADCSLEGNIASDSGEQRHGIFIQASNETGNLSNIAIGNIRGVNLRGDVVYLGTRDGRALTDVRVGKVQGANILRNVVSVVGGSRIAIERIAGTQVGYMHLDIEPDGYNGPVSGCVIGAVHGGFVQIAGQTPRASVDQVRIGLLNLVAPTGGSDPLYQHWSGRHDALTIRNLRSLEVDRFVAKGFGGNAIKQIWDRGALSDQRVHIASAEIRDCARDRRLANSYVLGNRHSTRIRIDDLSVGLLRPGVDVIRDCKTASVGRIRGLPAKGHKLITQSPELLEPLLYAAGGASAIVGGYYLSRVRTGLL